jgi:hypothetical protein
MATRPTTTARSRRSDVRPLVLAAITMAAVGVAVAVLIVVATNAPQPKKIAPFPAGLAKDLEQNVRDGGPVLVADPFGGHRSIWFALEGRTLVPLAAHVWHDNGCAVRWRGSVNHFVDCHGDQLTSEQLPRYASSIPSTGSQKGVMLVDVRTLLPPPTPPGA